MCVEYYLLNNKSPLSFVEYITLLWDCSTIIDALQNSHM